MPYDGLTGSGPPAAALIDAAQWDWLRKVVEAETGMDLSGKRFSRLQEAVTKVLVRHSGIRLETLVTDSRQRGAFLERVCTELTIGESFFFRNEHHFRALREHVLPAIIRENAATRELRVWSAGCATGEEPYSLAILLDQMLNGSLSDSSHRSAASTSDRSYAADRSDPTSAWKVHILATDLNTEFLEKAREARYSQWSFRGTDIGSDRNYFAPAGKGYRLHPRLRQQVRFSYLNLVKDVYPSPLTGTLALDLILFRNVAIYLQPDVTRVIIDRFHGALRPGGWLLLGETELNIAATDGFEVEHIGQATFHRRTGGRDVPLPKTSDAAAPRPVLADVTIPAAPAMPAVADIPDWVPLPSSRRPAASMPAARATSAWDRVERCLETRDFTQADRLIDGVPSRQERSELRVRYAQVLLARAEVARAHEALEASLRDEPLSIEAQLLKGSFAEEAGDLETAEQAYRRALYVDRKCAIAHFHLALVQQQQGDVELAGHSFQLVARMAGEREPHAVVEHGEGMCYGRLREMAERVSVD